jgi:hypothetical protein
MARVLAIAVPVIGMVGVSLAAGVPLWRALGAIATVAVLLFIAHVTGLGRLT